MDQINLNKWLIFMVFCVQLASPIDFVGQLRNVLKNMDNYSTYNFSYSYQDLFSDSTRLFSLDGISPECKTDLQLISNAIGNKVKKINDTFFDKAVVFMIDSSGKPLPGIRRGNSVFMGMVKQCEDISYTNTDRQFRSQYIRVLVDKTFKDYREVCKDAQIFSWDLCFPYSCTQPDLLKFFRRLITKSDKSPVCSVKRLRDNPEPLNYQSYIVIAVMSAVFLICLTASLYDAFILPNISPDESESFALTCFRCFSSYTIIGEILDTKLGSKPGQIPQLHCMRFFSMCWIILGHTSIILLLVSWNPAYYFELVGTLGGQILVNSYYAVDTFFFQSGLLLSYLWFRAYKRDPNQVNSTRSWLMFYVHRLLRLSPAYFVVIAFYTFVFTSFVAQFPVISLLKKFKVFSCFSGCHAGLENANRSIFITFSI